jgi:hypothetical protein
LEFSLKRSSEILADLIKNGDSKSDWSFQDLLQVLGKRSFGIAILFFALPSALPVSAIPGISFIFSIPIIFFSFQMIVSKSLWLPEFIGRRTITHETLAKIVKKANPFLTKLEYFFKPRLKQMTSRFMNVLNSLLIIFLGLLLMLPIPFSNTIIAGLIIIISLGITEKDGLMVLIGYVGAVSYTSFIYFILLGFIKAVFHFF